MLLGTCGDDDRGVALDSKYKVFVNHSGAQKPFVEHLCEQLERHWRFAFFNKCHERLPTGKYFPHLIFQTIQQCYVGVVILSEEFFTSKWSMMELLAMVEEVERGNSKFKIIPVFFHISCEEFYDPINRTPWISCWQELASDEKNKERIVVDKWEAALDLEYLMPVNGLVYDGSNELSFEKVVVDAVCAIVPAETQFATTSRMCKVSA